jgi:hypothetical protein
VLSRRSAIRFGAVALALTALALAVSGCNRSFDGSAVPGGYLTPKDIEATTGSTGVRIDKNPAGTYVFVEGASGRHILEVRTGSDLDFKRWKDVAGAYRAPVSGLGREAYQGPVEGREPTTIAVVKGDHALQMTAPSDMMGPAMSYEQLFGVATIAAGRM